MMFRKIKLIVQFILFSINISFVFSICFFLNSCSKKNNSLQSLEIVLPEGEQISYVDDGFSVYSINDYQAFLRLVVSNKKLQTLVDISPSQEELLKHSGEYHYLVPKGGALNGLMVVQIVVSKYSSFPLTSFIYSPKEKIRPSIESTLVYKLVSEYSKKDIGSYSPSDLKKLEEYIKNFMNERITLFGVDRSKPPRNIANFVKNGLSVDVPFLQLAKSMGIEFDFDDQGIVAQSPYPFGVPNNKPYIDEAKSTSPGPISSYEGLGLNVRAEAIDGDDDMLFLYWKYQDEIVLKDEHLWKKNYSFEDSNVVDKKNDPPFYKLEAIISDGGKDLVLSWSIVVADNNRPPEILFDCPTEIQEGETYHCKFKSKDLDGDLLRYQGLSLNFYSARPKFDELNWPGPTDFTSDTEFSWKPRNRNFTTANAKTVLSLVADDGKGGKANATVDLIMKDINSPPYPFKDSQGLVLRQVDDGEGPPRVQQLLNKQLVDPFLKKIDKIFYFELLVLDDDNKNLDELPDFDEIAQPLEGTSEFKPVLVDDFPEIEKNSINKITEPPGFSNLTNVHIEHQALVPSSVADAWANNVSFTATFIRDVDSTSKTIVKEGTILSLPTGDPEENFSYKVVADSEIPKGLAGAKTTVKVEKIIELPTKIRSFNIPAMSPESKKEFISIQVNGETRVAKRFIYAWIPQKLAPSVSAHFFPKDNHGGKGTSFVFKSTAIDMAQLPDCAGNGVFITNSVSYTTSNKLTCADVDNSLASSLFELSINQNSTGNPLKNLMTLVPFLNLAGSGNYPSAVLFKKNVFSTQNEFKYTDAVQSAGLGLNITLNDFSKFAGVLQFNRTNCSLPVGGASAISLPSIQIPAGTKFQSSYNGGAGALYNPRITFENTETVTFGPYDCSIMVPIVPSLSQRIISANNLSLIDVPVGEALLTNISVTHPALVATANKDSFSNNPSITATFKRTANSATSTLIKAGTAIRSSESTGSETFVYFVPVTTILPSGNTGTSVTIRMVRDFLPGSSTQLVKPILFYNSTNNNRLSSAVQPNTVTWLNTPIAGLTLIQPESIMPITGFTNEQYKTTVSIPGIGSFLDSGLPLANEVNQKSPMMLSSGSESFSVIAFRNSSEFQDLKIRNPAFVDPTFGIVEFYRDQSGGDLTIPAGLIISTADRKLYRVYRDEVLGNSNSVMVYVRRYYENDFKPLSKDFRFDFIDDNIAIKLIQFLSTTTIVNLTTSQIGEFPIEIADNSAIAPQGPMVPIDPWDRYQIDDSVFASGINYLTSVRPTGTVQLCRDLKVINSSCRPCTNSTDLTLSANETRYCYVRVSPVAADAAKDLDIAIRFTEVGPLTGVTSVTGTGRIKITEANNPPLFTDALYSPVAASCQQDFPGVTYLFNSAVSPSTTAQTLPPNTFTTTCTIPLVVESTQSNIGIYALDTDKDPTNNTINRFELSDFVFDLKTKTKIARPASMQLSVPNMNVAPYLAQGKKSTITLSWNPSDADSKLLSTDEGFIIGIRAIDSSTVDTPKGGVAYFKAQLKNINNPPSIGALTLMPGQTQPTSFSAFINTYFNIEMDIYDGDFQSLASPAFSTNLSLCRRKDGNLVKHPVFDAATMSDPTVCHLTGSDWETPYWDLSYTQNSAIAACRLGNGSLNPDLVVPKISIKPNPNGGPFVETGNRRVRYRYRIEWCPQAAYIGNYNINLTIADNGDMARSGSILSPITSSSLFSLNVVSNVYLLAPRIQGSTTVNPRQTAALAPPNNFIFPVYARNPLGNPLQFTLDTPMTATGMAIDSLTGVLSWPTLYPTMTDLNNYTSTDPALMPKVTVKVKDTVTNKTDKVTFSLRVQDPNLSPFEKVTTIPMVSPDNSSTLILNEKATTEFVAQGYDANLAEPNLDKLWAVWYLDDVIVQEEELFSDSAYFNPITRFYWRPNDYDGSNIGKSNGALLTIGEHSLRVKITDGNYWSEKEWRARVRNVFVVPEFLLSIQDERKNMEPAFASSINTFNWHTEIPFASITTGNTKPTEFLLFTGDFKRSSTLRKYLWRVDIVNGQISKLQGNIWNLYDTFNLTESGKIQRMAVRKDPLGFPIIYGTSKTAKYPTYTGQTSAYIISGNLTQINANLPSTYACPNTSCDSLMFGSPGASGTYAGNINSFSVSDRNFYVDENSKGVYWDIEHSMASKKPVLVLGGSSFVGGMVVNKNTKRLYVSYFNSVVGGDFISVFNIAPALNSTTANISVPLFTYSVNHPTDVSQVTLPSDMALASKTGRTDLIFVFLKGSGGVLTISDPASRIPNSTDFQFLGMNTISASQSDVLRIGSKLGYDPVSDNVIGLSREGRQIFTINPDNLAVSVSSHISSYKTTINNFSDVKFDSLVIMPLTGSLFFVDRKDSLIFKGR